jgi:hypothetical protein
MTKKNNKIEEIDEKILLIFDSAVFPLSISEITKMLNEDFNIKVSPQIVKRELLKLKKEKKIY